MVNVPREQPPPEGEAADTTDKLLPLPLPDDPAGEWVVVRTRPRCEKQVARFCETAGIHHYLPLLTSTHTYGARVRSFTNPLFPGYVFCRLKGNQFDGVRQQRNVARMLRTPDQHGLVMQLRSIHQALAASEVVEVLPFLEEGKPVIVKAGRLKGVEGVILRLKGKSRVVINVEMIQQAVAIEVDSQDLGPA